MTRWTNTWQVELLDGDGAPVVYAVIGRNDFERIHNGGFNRFAIDFPKIPHPTVLHGYLIRTPAGDAVHRGELTVPRHAIPTLDRLYFDVGQMQGEDPRT